MTCESWRFVTSMSSALARIPIHHTQPSSRSSSATPLPATAPYKLVRVITRMNIGGPSRHVTILTTQGAPEFDSKLLAGDPEPREGSLEDEAVAEGAHVVHVPHLRRPVS